MTRPCDYLTPYEATGTQPLTGYRRVGVLCPKPGRLPGQLPTRGLRGGSAVLKMKAEGRCRLCLPTADPAPLTKHHLVPETWFRLRRKKNPALYAVRNSAANIIPLCRRCHDRVESSEVARRALRELLAQDEVAFAIQSIGRLWLETTYPTGSGAGQ